MRLRLQGSAEERHSFFQRFRLEELRAAVLGAVDDIERNRQPGALVGSLKLVGLIDGHLDAPTGLGQEIASPDAADEIA
jgi:hypothetical protein